MNNLRFAVRQLLKHPGSTAIILATLALVIGTMSLAFGVVQRELSAWMPFPHPDRIFRLCRRCEVSDKNQRREIRLEMTGFPTSRSQSDTTESH